MFMTKPKVGKWQFMWTIQPERQSGVPGWRILSFGIFKFKTLPKEGERVDPSTYDGFIVTALFWLPYIIL